MLLSFLIPNSEVAAGAFHWLLKAKHVLCVSSLIAVFAFRIYRKHRDWPFQYFFQESSDIHCPLLVFLQVTDSPFYFQSLIFDINLI